MVTRIIATFILISLLCLSTPLVVHALRAEPPSGGPSGKLFKLGKIVNIIQKIIKLLKSLQAALNISGYVPHTFPFGGHILSSKSACTLKFWTWTYIPTPIGVIPVVCPNCVPIPFGTAITVGPPLPVKPPPGTVITFPFISQIYLNHNEKKVGPWALGLGFTPFPLNEINDALSGITLPNPLDNCAIPHNPGYVCFDHIHLDCAESGEKDKNGKDIYKVIRLLGTGPATTPISAP